MGDFLSNIQACFWIVYDYRNHNLCNHHGDNGIIECIEIINKSNRLIERDYNGD